MIDIPSSALRTSNLRAFMLAMALFASEGHANSVATKAYDEARKALERDELSAAAIHLKNALQADKSMLAAHLLLGRVLASMGEYKAAEAALEEALRLGVSRTEVAPLLGPVYLQLGEANKVLELVTANSPVPSVKAQALTLRGSALAMSGSLTQALAAFAEARSVDPSLADPYIAEAPVFLRMDARDKAIASARKGTELAPKRGSAWYQLGTILHGTGDLSGALVAFDKSLVLEPKHVDAHVSRAMVLLGLGRREEAEKTLNFLKTEKVREPRASWLRGMLAGANGRSDLAKAEFSDAVGMIDPMAPAVRNNSEPLLLAGALSHYHLRNPEKAREYLTTLLGRNSRHVAGQLLLATILVEARDLNRAQPMLEGLLRSMPDHPEVLHLLGRVHAARGQLGLAAEFLERASRAPGGQDALRDLSVVQLAGGAKQQGEKNLEKVFAKNPADVTAGMELAVHYARTGQGAKAVQVAESLLKLSPSEPALLNFLGNIHGRLSDRKRQRQAYQAALEKAPNFRPVVVNMAWLESDEGLHDAARARLEALLKQSPRDYEVLTQLGVIEQRARRSEKALEHFQKADSLQTKDPRPGLAALETLLQLRRVEPALAAARSMAGRFPGDFTVLLAAARAYTVGGNQALARTSLQEATKVAGYRVPMLLEVARLQMRLGLMEGAMHALAKAQQVSPDDVGVMLLNVEMAGVRRAPAAELDKALASAMAKHPKHPGVQVTAGHVAMSRGQFAKAAASYRTSFEQAPSTELAALLARALLANNETEKALATLESWSKRNPSDVVAKRALADAQVLAGKPHLARTTYEALIAAQPNNEELLAAFAQILRRLGDPLAVSMAEKAYKLAPHNLNLADGYGWALTAAGNVEAGVRVLREARLRDPAHAAVRWHLAAALMKAGRKVEAREEVQAAMSAGLAPPSDVDPARLRVDLGL
ncbi:XrtA/PEP-CTERM system TPR-repeat protein PrsT [Inhella sp.]|uniref:XrtA/PEP-CTERM system TPR-repeat protein PrsT n=1 Tax=Inhella sp. TaxID=1921806 RepID=UPI0035AFC36A